VLSIWDCLLPFWYSLYWSNSRERSSLPILLRFISFAYWFWLLLHAVGRTEWEIRCSRWSLESSCCSPFSSWMWYALARYFTYSWHKIQTELTNKYFMLTFCTKWSGNRITPSFASLWFSPSPREKRQNRNQGLQACSTAGVFPVGNTVATPASITDRHNTNYDLPLDKKSWQRTSSGRWKSETPIQP